MRESLVYLLQLQDIDLEIAELEKKMRALEEAEQIQAAAVLLEKALDQVEQTRERLRVNNRRIKDLENKLEDRQAVIKELDEKIFSGESSSKELSFLIKSKDHERAAQAKLEEILFQTLEALEELNSAMLIAETALAAEEKRYQEVKEAVMQEAGDDRVALAELKSRQSELHEKIDNKLLRSYLSKSKRLNYRFVCAVDDKAVCEGCRVKLPSRVFKRLLSGEIARCDECGRYLICLIDEK